MDDLLLVMAMRQLGSTWQKVTISSAIRTPRIFFAAAAMFCPHMTSLTIKSFYHATPQDDHQVENDIFNDLGLTADDTAPLVVHSLTMEKSVINTSTLESLFARCAYLQKLVFIQCKSMLSAGRFFSTMMHSLPANITINNLTIEQLNVNDYDDCIFGTNPGDLCAMLQTRPPKSLNLNKCEMYREAVQAIVESMQSGTLVRYNRSFDMAQPQSRTTLQTCLRVDKTWQMVVDEIERETIQSWMDSQGWYDEDMYYADYEFYDPDYMI